MVIAGGIGGGQIMPAWQADAQQQQFNRAADQSMPAWQAAAQQASVKPGFVNQPPLKISPRSRVGRGPEAAASDPANLSAPGQAAARPAAQSNPSEVVVPGAQQPVQIPAATEFGGVGPSVQLPPGLSRFRGQVMPNSQVPGAFSSQTIPAYPGNPQGAAQPGQPGAPQGAAGGGGRLGGAATSRSKGKAARRNGLLGGRPKKVLVKNRQECSRE